MAKTATDDAELKKGAKVVATTELRGVPEGTAGKVVVKNGIRWIRYWVRFENGVTLGSIDRSALATPEQLRREAAGESAVAGAAAGSEEAASADAGGGDAGGVATPSGTLVPQKLLDRSAAARARLAA